MTHAHIYLATLGERPQAVTVGLDKLRTRYTFEQIGILHTDPTRSDIHGALRTLRHEIRQSYPELTTQFHELLQPDGASLLDIESEEQAMAYYQGVLRVLLEYKKTYQGVLHLMVAGGRKAMSIYAVFAASVLLSEQDHVWSVHTPKHLLETGSFHLRGDDLDHVQLVSLPYLPTRLATTTLRGMNNEDLNSYVQKHRQRHKHLLDSLSDAQQLVVKTLSENPHATNAQLAKILGLAPKTVDRHLDDTYHKMRELFDLGETRPRAALLSVLKEGITASPPENSH